MNTKAYEIDSLKGKLAEAEAEIKYLKNRLYEIQKCAKNAQKILRDYELLSVN